jgi:hypothetical protein
MPSWTDAVAAVSTLALAALALASAVYARRLWVESQKQFAELRRSTDTDIALRMLDRCDESALTDAEQILTEFFTRWPSPSWEAFDRALSALADADRVKVWQSAMLVLTEYEHIGLVARHFPAAGDILVDYLCLRATQSFDALRPVVAHHRERGPAAHNDFERFAGLCRQAVAQLPPNPVVT